MTKLVLNVGDKVRNIRKGSSRFGWIGKVIRASDVAYAVEWNQHRIVQHYYREFAHNNLEKVDETMSAYDWVFSGERKVLKRDRRNVISGKTQSEYSREYGAARGIELFNTRCLGRTTAQALHLLYSAMSNPNMRVRITGDHAVEDFGVPVSVGDKHLRSTIEDIVSKCDFKGINFDNGGMTFNPIVTEETYVQ